MWITYPAGTTIFSYVLIYIIQDTINTNWVSKKDLLKWCKSFVLNKMFQQNALLQYFMYKKNRVICLIFEHSFRISVKLREMKNQMGFLIQKIFQILQPFAWTFCWAQTSYFWRVILEIDQELNFLDTFQVTISDVLI